MWWFIKEERFREFLGFVLRVILGDYGKVEWWQRWRREQLSRLVQQVGRAFFEDGSSDVEFIGHSI